MALLRKRRVLYTSSPDRGADIALEIWPRVRERVPDAELVLTYARWFDMVADRVVQANDFRQKVLDLLHQPGVHRIEGGLGQKDLAHLMMTSLVWIHPSWYTDGDMQFHETSCISSIEAQAAGCVVVASNWGAITESVVHGTLIDGDPREEDGSWRQAFVDAIVQGLTDEQTQLTAQELGPEAVKHMGWDGAAEQLAAMFPAGDNGMRANYGYVERRAEHHPV